MNLPAFNQQAVILDLMATPPLTPDPDAQQLLLPPGSVPALASAPATRTPRKLQHPQKSTSCENRRDSVIVSFRLVQHEDHQVPSLSISTTTLTRTRLSRVKRRLFASDYDSMEGSDCDIREQKEPSLSLGKRVRKTKCGPSALSEMDGTDADDEMEHATCSASYLSPPYSPAVEESSTTETSPNDSMQHVSQPQRKSNSHGGLVTPKVKTCASCKTKKTPLWRDSDDGTPYCNACGIRFKKYHVRCSSCFYIPRKDEKVNNSCCLCGSRLIHCRHH